MVVVHNSARELGCLLDSVQRHLLERPQVVVVDSGSSDDGGELACRWGAEVITLANNAGFGAANNAGLARVGAPVTALVNPDIELLDSGLIELVALARGQDRLLVPRLVNEDGSTQRSAHPRPGTLEALLPALMPAALLPRRLRLRAEPWRDSRSRSVGWAIAACVVARTETLRRLGPFDPAPFLFYEDLDLCLRAADEGVATVLAPQVRLRHSGGHATRRVYGGEPHEVMARRRRQVVNGALGRRALALDDAAQALTFAGRALARASLGRDSRRERAQLRALLAARRAPPRGA